MRDWKFWDWTAYACLFIAAILLAAKEPIEKIEAMNWLSTPIWSYVPLLLVVVATLLLIGRSLGWLGSLSASSGKPWSDKMETINRHSYINERVEIDGKIFDHCRFTNAAFLYRGTGPTAFLESTFIGSTFLETSNQVAKSYLMLSESLRTHPGVAAHYLGERDEHSGEIRIISQKKPSDSPPKK